MALSILLLLLGCAYGVVALDLPRGSLAQPGAGLFPLLVGAGTVIAGVLAIWDSRADLIASREEKAATPEIDVVATPHDFEASPGVEVEEKVPAKGGAGTALVLLIGFGLYVFTLPRLGHAIATTAFVGLSIKILSDLSAIRVVVYAAIISIATYYLFIELFGVDIPLLPG